MNLRFFMRAPVSFIGPKNREYYKLTKEVKQTIRVLEKTKSAFKSKDLGAMCKRLEELMETTKKNQEISKLDRYNS